MIMKKNSILFFSLLITSVSLIGSIQNTDGLEGSWTYEVEQTAPEYSRGSLLFEQGENDEYSGKIVFQSGREITMSSVDVVADTVTFKAYVDGGLVTTICTLEGDVLTGSVQTAEGYLPFSAKREE